jgi:hypothetical protein
MKASDVLNEGSLRFFLGQAEKVGTKVLNLVSSKKASETKDSILSRVSEAFRSGLIVPLDLQDVPYVLQLNRPLIFADRPEEQIDSLLPDEVEGYLDRPILIGGDPTFTADFADDNGVRMTVRTCREYRAALAVGFYAPTTYDIKSEAFLKAANLVLTAAASLKMPVASFIRTPYVGLADLDLLPSSVLPCLSIDDEELVKALGPIRLGDLLRRGDIRLLDFASNQIAFEWQHMGIMLREICRADFDGDGVEDILCECYSWAPEGTLGFGWTSLITRTDSKDIFAISRIRD